jgi:hypothetical protein
MNSFHHTMQNSAGRKFGDSSHLSACRGRIHIDAGDVIPAILYPNSVEITHRKRVKHDIFITIAACGLRHQRSDTGRKVLMGPSSERTLAASRVAVLPYRAGYQSLLQGDGFRVGLGCVSTSRSLLRRLARRSKVASGMDNRTACAAPGFFRRGSSQEMMHAA